MMSIPVYYKMLKLQASNKNLLKNYYTLYYQISGEEADYQREQISRRIALRERFKLEISQFLEDQKVPENKGNWSKWCVQLMPTIIGYSYDTQHYLLSQDWDTCYELEVGNVDEYYNLLYSQRLSRPLTDLLLKQKGCVEDFLLCEVA